MSLKTVSNMIYQGDIADLPPLTAPMPRGGVYYADLVNSLFVSKPDSNFSKNRNYATALSFTRTTLASFISAAGNLEYAAINTPRIDRHPATRKILGMRVENSATNYALSALDQTAANYVPSGLTVSAPAAGWCTLTESTMNEAHVLMDNQSTIDPTLYNVVSLFAKAGSAQYLQI
ncbi:hypothetical protein PXW56_26730, partial [Klebsiella pneumoniae]|nr:hypothetical protein [Klebsiella pneumoniae]